MKTSLRLIVLNAFVLFLLTGVHAQTASHRVSNKFENSKFSTKQNIPSEVGQVARSQRQSINNSIPMDPLSSLISVPNASNTGISGLYDLQTNGRGLHNILIDPTDPNKIHVCVMTTTSSDPTDTNGQSYPSRRVVYTYSADGGTTWTNPVIVSGATRTGYPDMTLIKRGSNYFPIIAAHRYEGTGTTTWQSAIYIDTGAAPGAGKFAEFKCDRLASDNSDKDLLWPSIALSNDNSTLYIIADFSNQASAAAMDYMEFGSFALADGGKSATWKGWTAQPGGADGLKGYSSSGRHVIRVGSDDRIGVLWINPDAAGGDHNMYFVESMDKGKTWPTTVNALFPAVVDVDNNRAMAADNGLDFFYDGTTPHFVWEVDEMIYNVSDSNGVYYPYTGQIFYWDGNLGDVKCLNYNDDRAYTITAVPINGSASPDSVNYMYQNPTFSVANNPVLQTAGGIDFPHFASVELPTFARTGDSKFFAIFYEAISDNDHATITDRDGGTHEAWYSGIYYQYTTDGGATWGEPKPFRVNIAGDASSLDYRYPEAPSISPINKGSNFPLLFGVDSLAGIFSSNGDDGAGYSYTSWYYQNYAVNAVPVAHVGAPNNALSQNYPNPFVSATTIPVNMAADDVVTLSVTDLLGREIAVLYHGSLSAGAHTIPFTAPNLGAGVYTYTLKTSAGSVSRTMSLVK